MGSARFIWVLIALGLLTAFFEIGQRDVVEDNEGQRATPPAEMLRNHNFVIPTLNDKDYLAKPPLLYWAIAGVYAATGVISPTTSRIPTGLSYVALVLCVYAASRRRIGEMGARWAALAVLVAPYVVDRARYAELDVPLTWAIFLAIVALHTACEASSSRKAFLFAALGGVAFGAGILLKGPVPFLFLFAAWIAQLVCSSRDRETWWRTGIVWTLGLFAIGVLLWLAALWKPGLSIKFPVALIGVAIVWIVLGWRHAGEPRARALKAWLGIMLVGIAVAAPWGVAVLVREGWPFVDRLLHSEVLERTHTATRINSGSPFYYLAGLLGMLAPWGLLLPCQASKESWRAGTPFYQFSVLTGWLSVIVFSLIAGKEYEYVLPAAPFLLIATGSQLAEFSSNSAHEWQARWIGIWRDVMLAILPLLAIGFMVIVAQRNRPVLFAGILACAVTLAALIYGIKQPTRRLASVAAVALCAVLLWTFSQDYRYRGQHSFKTVATATGDLLRAGYDVEAVKMTSAFDVFPGFAFYARTRVPTVLDAEHVRAKLAGPAPYYCVLRQDLIPQLGDLPRAELATPLLGPCTSKKVVIIGNQPLPETIVADRSLAIGADTRAR